MTEKVEWLTVKPGSVWLGDNDGRLSIYPLKNRPHHQVKIDYSFEITKQTYPVWDNKEDAKLFAEKAFPAADFEGQGLRPPTEAEWDLAHSQGLLKSTSPNLENLIDRGSPRGFWGQRCDGFPRTTSYYVKLNLRKKWDDGTPQTVYQAKNRTNSKTSEVTHLVRLEEQKREVPPNPARLPTEEEHKKIIIREIAIALLIGVAPAFLWAFNFASPSYISTNWPSIAFGGLVFSIFTGFVWRPKRPSYHVSENGKTMETCSNTCSHEQ
ncbi:MAG: hypothetical protein H8D82_01755 [Euryarchaeota archaeon]|nr:hypothetical protein [Euryarchaeota archaeon]